MTLPKTFPYILVIGGAVGIVMSFLLTLDKIALLKNPDAVLPCNINPIISCGSVINTEQASAFGVPNPMLGMVGYSVVATVGIIMFFGAVMNKKFWNLFLAGLILAEVFIHLLIYESLYIIGSLCLYCMITWVTTWPIFIFTLVNLYPSSFINKNRYTILIGWYLLIILLILIRFRDFFLT